MSSQPYLVWGSPESQQVPASPSSLLRESSRKRLVSLTSSKEGGGSLWEGLEARAGASDRDRELWLAERRGGVTATELARLWRKRDLSGAMSKLAGEKLSGFAGWDGNVYTRWGQEREPVIAGLVEREHGILPESRVFRSAVNERWLASPDGVGVGGDGELWLSEIKTSGEDITVGSKKFHASRYLPQMVWSMGVLGASRCLYTWEYRLGSPYEGFVPGSRQSEWVVFEEHEELWFELQGIASRFLDVLDSQAEVVRWESPIPVVFDGAPF